MKLQKRELSGGDGKGGLFLKFKDGETKVGVLRGEVYEFYQKWENGRSQVVEPGTPESKSRFRLNFVTKEDGEMKVKIFEFGLTIYNMLADISDDYDLEQTAVKITRRGTGTDTTYMIIPAKEQPNAQQLKAIQALQLNILEHKDAPQVPSQADDDGSLPF